ncbi:MAG: hypothetical protein AAGA54_20805 [Myxococcota bacterium]
MPRFIPTVAIACLALGWACGIDELLIGAPCDGDADCPNLICARTASETAADGQGRCSEDGTCVPGEQDGCRARSDNTCDLSLQPVQGPNGNRYCCGRGTNTTVVGFAEDGTAECADCPSCSTLSGTEEPCLAGEARCEVEDGMRCGCRTPGDRLLNEDCEGDDDCGALVCVRTLEQQEEPDEAAVPDRAAEDGQCRPSDDPACAPGQSGCLLPSGSSCDAMTQAVGVGSLEYCCPTPGNSVEFQPVAYARSADQREVACTTCRRRSCMDDAGNLLDECTTISADGCHVPTGALCGCPPGTE